MPRIIDFDGGLDQIFFVKMENICNKKLVWLFSVKCFEMIKQICVWFLRTFAICFVWDQGDKSLDRFLLNGCFDIPFLIQICREGADWQLLSQRVLLAVDMTCQTFSNNTFPSLANVTFAMLGLPCCRSEQNCQSCNMPDLSVLLQFLKYMFSSSWMETKTTDFNVNEI